jgi:hypothetical protein
MLRIIPFYFENISFFCSCLFSQYYYGYCYCATSSAFSDVQVEMASSRRWWSTSRDE